MTGLSWGLLSTMAVVNAMPYNVLPRDDKSYEILDCSETQQGILKTAFEDAAALAKIADDIDDDSTAFTHYLRTDDKKETKKLWKAIRKNQDAGAPYKFNVRCAKSCTGDEKDSLAIADSTKVDDDDTRREIKICPLFFTDDRTKNNLASKSYEVDKRGSWCQTGQKFKDFETGGHTILHEMTHLDVVGKEGDLPERTQDGFSSHGTDDVQGYGDDYTSAARAFLTSWVNDKDSMDDNALKPYQNAENVAAAATEWWFIKSCSNIDNIEL
ncbi:sgnh hydrolase [Diplodia corticola]|uniref:Sgnh hydrolase n=1 Tax=Diplodia corticola TaxID=236234 RepID=A0A1J9RB72_9PEZI|nr:sgnh hydrolase [Diplodia corticola]OJD37394.1 sgnh hydrolase [Diplodia corticola]